MVVLAWCMLCHKQHTTKLVHTVQTVQQQNDLDSVRIPLYEVFKELLGVIKVAQVVLGHCCLGHYPVTLRKLLRQGLHRPPAHVLSLTHSHICYCVYHTAGCHCRFKPLVVVQIGRLQGCGCIVDNSQTDSRYPEGYRTRHMT